jgi:hypothetical protein
MGFRGNRRNKLVNIVSLRTGILAFLLVVAPFFIIPEAHAAQITGRSIGLSSSAGAATGVTYFLGSSALPTTATAVKSVGVQFCTSLIGTCTAPTGMVTTSSTLSSQPTGLGATTGWTVNNGTAGSLRITGNAGGTLPSSTVSITWANVTNPTANNTSFYAIITTYSDAAWTTPVDTGSVSLSTATQLQVALTVSEVLVFCTGTSITGTNCATAAGSTVAMGSASPSVTASGTSIMAASTNAGGGYSVTVSGTTLTNGGNTVSALAANAGSTVGTKQFGMNLVANTTPAVGTAVSGTGTGAAATNYNTANSYRFVTGDVVASATIPTNGNAFTVSYIANVDGLTPPGSYTTNLTYVATANF